jgi:hypothetical protein
VIVVSGDLSGPPPERPDRNHPESEYEARHANYADGDLRDLPDLPRRAANRYSGGRR